MNLYRIIKHPREIKEYLKEFVRMLAPYDIKTWFDEDNFERQKRMVECVAYIDVVRFKKSSQGLFNFGKKDYKIVKCLIPDYF